MIWENLPSNVKNIIDEEIRCLMQNQDIIDD